MTVGVHQTFLSKPVDEPLQPRGRGTGQLRQLELDSRSRSLLVLRHGQFNRFPQRQFFDFWKHEAVSQVADFGERIAQRLARGVQFSAFNFTRLGLTCASSHLGVSVTGVETQQRQTDQLSRPVVQIGADALHDLIAVFDELKPVTFGFKLQARVSIAERLGLCCRALTISCVTG